jgi:aminobenzoyl-glutamate utilization protein A
MSSQTQRERLVEVRRDLHAHPEPAWREFYTTARIVEELERLDVDALHVGPDALGFEPEDDTDLRMGVPDDGELEAWFERALDAGADPAVLDRLRGGYTGAVAELHAGEGPTVALRVDVDGLPIEESASDDHLPAREGFRSATGAMHACGHDGHATIGLGVLEAVQASDFAGTLKVLFQPAEEVIGGGKAMARSGHLDDVDALLAVHLGLDHPTGEVVAGIDGFLAVEHIDATFHGETAHAGAHPEAGANAVQALATAVQNLYAIPRHSDGATRVNAGKVQGGTASNIVADGAFLEGEVRGETTELKDYMSEKAWNVVEQAAAMHDCTVDLETGGEAPSATSDEALVEVVDDVASGTEGVDSVLHRDELGGSEDATYLMQAVQDAGGLAAYVGVGTDHPGGHHTPTFDVDEASLDVGVAVLADTIQRLPGTLR